jgi:hypothetical protein
MKRAIGVGVAASVGVVTLIALAARSSRQPTIEPRAEAHMWAVLAGEAAS